MPIELHISAETVGEFDHLIARFAGTSTTAIAAATARPAPHDPVMPEVRAAATDTGVSALSVADVKTAAASAGPETLRQMLAEEQAGKNRTGAVSAIQAAIAAAAPTQQPDGTPIAPTPDPAPQPTPGGTSAPPAESIPPKQEAAVDPFAAPAASAGDQAASGSATAATSTAAPATETASATPAATSPVDQAAAAGGEVTVQHLKDAMADLLKAKSASFAMATLEQATGCKSLTTGSPSVVEKAKDDPAIMRRTLDALVAAKTAA